MDHLVKWSISSYMKVSLGLSIATGPTSGFIIFLICLAS